MDRVSTPSGSKRRPSKSFETCLEGEQLATAALQTKVYFHAAPANISTSESVGILGGHPSLGDWDPRQALRLTTDANIEPCWITSDPIFVDSGAQIEYTYIAIDNGDGSHRTLDVGGTSSSAAQGARRSFRTSGHEMVVEDDEGLYREKTGLLQDDGEEEEMLKTKRPSPSEMDKAQRLAFVNELEGKVDIDSISTVFMIAIRLPVKVEKDAEGKFVLVNSAPTDGRNFAFLPLMKELREKYETAYNVRILSVGWPGIHVDCHRERVQIEKLLAPHGYIPVFPPKKEFMAYQHFCTTVLFPVFHDVMAAFQSSCPKEFDLDGWSAYQYINNVFANTVIPHTHEHDLIWIHDFHMLMLPTFISRKLHRANIGFFLHAPFPSSDSFKALPVRDEILAGMLSADQLGFQFLPYARNFLVAVKRHYGLDPTFQTGGFVGVEYNGRVIMIRCKHFAYPYKPSEDLVRSFEVEVKTKEVRDLFSGKSVFACMDRCDGLSGLLPKLRAFKRFIRERPQFLGKAVLVQYVFDSWVDYQGVKQVRDSVAALADAFIEIGEKGRLKIVPSSGEGAISEAVIVLRFDGKDTPITRSERLSLFRASSVLFDTSVKSGLNLMPFEFITSHYDHEETHGVAITSEFSGCSRVLYGALRVNPWNLTELVSTCERALMMSDKERKERMELNLAYCKSQKPMDWFEDFMADLRRARKKEGIRVESIGFGARMRQVCVGQGFSKLNSEQVVKAYRSAKNRVLFLDNEGTLAADTRRIFRQYGAAASDVNDVDNLKGKGSGPNEVVLQCLTELCADNRNTVVILSGRDRQMMDEWFGSVPGISLAAERGFYYKLPLGQAADQWLCCLQNPDQTWKSYAYEIMRQFVMRTQGSYVENKGSALVWQYRDADQHFGSWQAKELTSTLKELLFGFDVDVVDGKGYVEVKLRGIDKGTACSRVLAQITQAMGEVDFVLCLGDDRSDEDMFETINAFIEPDGSSQMSTTDDDSDSQSDKERDRSMPRQSGLGSGDQGGGLGGRLRSKQSFDMKSSGMLHGSSFHASGSLSGDLSALIGSVDQDTRPRKYFTCTVGRKPSAANYFVDDTEEVSELLMCLRMSSKKKAPSSTWSAGADADGMRSAGSLPSLTSLSFSPSGYPRSGGLRRGPRGWT